MSCKHNMISDKRGPPLVCGKKEIQEQRSQGIHCKLFSVASPVRHQRELFPEARKRPVTLRLVLEALQTLLLEFFQAKSAILSSQSKRFKSKIEITQRISTRSLTQSNTYSRASRIYPCQASYR